jgi:hypothetical protein
MNIYLLTSGGGSAAQKYGLAAQANFEEKKTRVGGAHLQERGNIICCGGVNQNFGKVPKCVPAAVDVTA